MRKPSIAAILLFAYSAFLIALIVFKLDGLVIRTRHLKFRFTPAGPGPSNFVPFRTIWAYLHGNGGLFISLANLLGNIIPFMPVGFLLPCVLRRMRWKQAVTAAVAVGLTMELMESVLRVGTFDVDDIILNALGVTLGYAAFALLEKRRTRTPRPS